MFFDIDVHFYDCVLLHPRLWQPRCSPPDFLRSWVGREERTVRVQANHRQDSDFILQEQVGKLFKIIDYCTVVLNIKLLHFT